ncbi:uncharacterized protein LOC115888129 [Sitophilus oryzae]|uniref:Uncharacterized protein LOC115888129 n=1 Tax=Sitophilus oryzae TaxID=7048 RepID=A0A6J2YKA9_SITOR|nr:uncharacterized protein LOC115888129 [Sitophilus oryzae]
MCESLTLKIMNGFFPHKEVHKFTWVQRTRRLSSIIDYMILRQNSILKTNDVRVYRGIECGSDHYLLMAKVVIKYRSSQKEREEHKGNQGKVDSVNYNLDSLRHESVQFLYKLRLASKLQNIQMEQINTEELYKTIKDSIHQAAEEALGHQKYRCTQNPEWWSEELEEVTKNKKKAYQKWLLTENSEDQIAYKRCNIEVKRIVREKKNESWDRKCEHIERYMGGSKVSEAWKAIKNIRRENKRSAHIDMINMEKWQEYYKILLTED